MKREMQTVHANDEIKGEEVLAWLREQPGDMRMGFIESYGKSCPVGCYLNRDGGDVVVSIAAAFYRDTRRPLDAIAQQIVTVFDRMYGYNHTVAEFLAAWEARS